MISEAGNIIGRAVLAVFSFFTEFDLSLGGVLTSTVLGFFTMYTVTRLFLTPLIGQASSDLVSDASKDLVFGIKKRVRGSGRKTVTGFRGESSTSKKK